MVATYDEIGVRYANHRRPDPRIDAAIARALGSAERIVDVGAGTGSYEPSDRRVVAVEPSAVMIRQRSSRAPVVRASADALPFTSGTFDAALAVLTIHHWSNWRPGVREMRRVADRIVVLTFDVSRFQTFWLVRDYIPAAVALDRQRTPSVEAVADALGATRIETVPVPHDCVDGFCCAYWRRPEAYLDPEVRACISCFAQLDPSDVLPGIARLRADLDSGRWHQRQADLLTQDEFDGGYRLIVRE
ncbi:MAG TPA: class I SAM-dependent methyltransferase [Candidatus Binatia bacterium]|nr:class I SAM-dependent methyltransferase [Candidatus Binatia bacterium]